MNMCLCLDLVVVIKWSWKGNVFIDMQVDSLIRQFDDNDVMDSFVHW